MISKAFVHAIIVTYIPIQDIFLLMLAKINLLGSVVVM